MLKDQLRKARKAADKTQKAVADYLGITESTYCGYETGKRQPDALKIKKIAAFLGVTGDYLLETGADPETRHPETAVPESREAAGQRRLVNLYLQLNEEGQDKLVDYADDLVSSSKYIKNGPAFLVQEAAGGSIG